MDLRNDPLYAEAIFFLEDSTVIKEMLFVEFQAVLDGVVGVPEFAGKLYKACYISIWDSLTVHAIVLFEVPFDKNGHVIQSWNLPLRFLASEAIPGPNLGAGNLLLMTAPVCQDSEYKKLLWDPGKDQLQIITSIRDAVKRNKLGLYREDIKSSIGFYQRMPASDRARTSAYIDEEYQEQLVQNVESTLKYKYEHQLSELAKQHEEVVRQLECEIRQLTEKVRTADEQVDQLTGQLHQANMGSKQHIEIIAGKYRTKMQRALTKLKTEMSEQLEIKEMELQYSTQSEALLQEELKRMEERIVRERKEAVQDCLVEMIDSGVEFIVTQSGIGSFSLKLEHVEGYLENPPGFWAKQCGVTEVQYLAWYKHYKDPTCQAGSAAGCACGKAVKRVEYPDKFIQGVSEMCPAHRLLQANNT